MIRIVVLEHSMLVAAEDSFCPPNLSSFPNHRSPLYRIPSSLGLKLGLGEDKIRIGKGRVG